MSDDYTANATGLVVFFFTHPSFYEMLAEIADCLPKHMIVALNYTGTTHRSTKEQRLVRQQRGSKLLALFWEKYTEAEVKGKFDEGFYSSENYDANGNPVFKSTPETEGKYLMLELAPVVLKLYGDGSFN